MPMEKSMEPEFLAQFGEIIDQYLNGKIEFVEAKRGLLDLFSHHSGQPNGPQIGFDLSSMNLPIKIKELLKEVLQEGQASFFQRVGVFGDLTVPVQRAMHFAAEQAISTGATEVSTEHLLLGLIQVDSDLLARFLGPGDTVENIRKEAAGDQPRHSPSCSQRLFNEQFQKVLAYAGEEAHRLSQKTVDTPHVLMGLLREEGGLAARILCAHGFELSRIRSALS
jgi:hypothetical protein